MRTAKAFLFDLNGTMIDDMWYHLDVWYDVVVNQLGARLTYEQVKDQLYGKSQEVLIRIFGEDRFSAAELGIISSNKEDDYQPKYRPHLELLPGLSSFLEAAFNKNINLAIGSAAVPVNIDFVLDTLK